MRHRGAVGSDGTREDDDQRDDGGRREDRHSSNELESIGRFLDFVSVHFLTE